MQINDGEHHFRISEDLLPPNKMVSSLIEFQKFLDGMGFIIIHSLVWYKGLYNCFHYCGV